VSYQLRRLHIPYGSRRDGGGHSTYLIDGTDIMVVARGATHTWTFQTDQTARPARDWLADHQLRHARFPTRAGAMRAFEAAAALNPPPAQQVTIRRVRRDGGRVDLIDPAGRRRQARPYRGGGWLLISTDDRFPGLLHPTLASVCQQLASAFARDRLTERRSR